ncbi:hypothetical protein OAX78_00580 [Planctomycetota bacterium]|nr:hypothetical protein [Planctomycetota bacterium]
MPGPEVRAVLVGFSTFRGLPELPDVPGEFERLRGALLNIGVREELITLIGLDDPQDPPEPGRLYPPITPELVTSSIRQLGERGFSGTTLVVIATHAIPMVTAGLVLATPSFNRGDAHTGLPVRDLAHELRGLRGGPLVVVLDCCHAAGAFGDLESLLDIGERDYCVIASTRQTDAACDSAYVRHFAAALLSVAPSASESATTIERLHTRAASGLRSEWQQTARIVLKSDCEIPIGRQYRGVLPTRDRVIRLLEGTGVTLQERPEGGDFDLLEVRTDVYGFSRMTALAVAGDRVVGTSADSLRASLERVVDRGLADKAVAVVPGPFKMVTGDHVRLMSFADLRRRVSPLCQYLELRSRALRRDHAELTQEELYISLYADEKLSDGVDSPQQPVDDLALAWARQDDAFASVMVLLGEFGTGKSTTARTIFLRQCEEFLSDPARNRCPILVDLHRAARHGVRAALKQDIERLAGPMAFRALDEATERGRFLWILDGFDELGYQATPTELSGRVAEIGQVIRGQAKLVLTSRTAFFRGNSEMKDLLEPLARNGEGVRHVYVQNFVPYQVRDFVRHRLARDQAEQVLKQITGDTAMAQPLILHLTVDNIDELQEGRDGFSIAHLYSVSTAKALARDNWKRAVPEEEDRLAFCEALAWHLQEKRTAQISHDALRDIVRTTIKVEGEDRHALDRLTRAMQTTTFLARGSDEPGEPFSFAHKSFQEYFCAGYLIRNASCLEERVISPEIARFVADLAPPPPPIASDDGSYAASIRETAEEVHEHLTYPSRRKCMAYVRSKLFGPAGLSRGARYVCFDQSTGGTSLRGLLAALVWVVVLLSGASGLLLLGADLWVLGGASALSLCGVAVLPHVFAYVIRARRGRAAHPVACLNYLAIYGYKRGGIMSGGRLARRLVPEVGHEADRRMALQTIRDYSTE